MFISQRSNRYCIMNAVPLLFMAATLTIGTTFSNTTTSSPEETDTLVNSKLMTAIVCIVLLGLSFLFSGLTLGLLSLDQFELKVVAACGTPIEREYAKRIIPLRKKGNQLLCSLVLGNVFVNSTFTVLLETLIKGGTIVIVISTFGIVIIGEILPQAIGSRYALAFGAQTAHLTRLIMIITFPFAYPISKTLDYFLGEELGNVFDREKLQEYLRLTKDYAQLDNEELKIIFGALELTKKTAAEIMTKLEDVFMVDYESVLNFETLSEIVKRGYTRIPVYSGERKNIVSLLNTKDLSFVDPDDEIALKTLCEFYRHPLCFVHESETLDKLLKEFKKGKSHMGFVRRLLSGAKDSAGLYEVVGIVTLEDVIEEIIQAEIIDETDVVTDNRRKLKREGAQGVPDFTEFVKADRQEKKIVSAPTAFAVFQYLSTAVKPFTQQFVSRYVLRRLLSQNIYHVLKPRKKIKQRTEDDLNDGVYLFEVGKAADYFAMIIEGHARVSVGAENLTYETGPFSCFGVAVLQNAIERLQEQDKSSTFIPDYSVQPVSNILYLKITENLYTAAVRTSQSNKSTPATTVTKNI